MGAEGDEMNPGAGRACATCDFHGSRGSINAYVQENRGHGPSGAVF